MQSWVCDVGDVGGRDGSADGRMAGHVGILVFGNSFVDVRFFEVALSSF